MLRYKGVLYLKDNAHRVVFQGVHMLMGGDLGRPWGKDEKRSSTMVFIGRNLPEDLFIKGLEQCLVQNAVKKLTGKPAKAAEATAGQRRAASARRS